MKFLFFKENLGFGGGFDGRGDEFGPLGGRRGRGNNSPAGIVREFGREGNKALRLIDRAIRRSNDTALNAQLQQIRDTFVA